MNLSDNPGLSGPLPPTLTALARIESLFANQTDLCAPPDKRVRAWLEGLADGYVPTCLAGEREAAAYLTQAAEPRTSGVPLVGGKPALLRVFVPAARATSLPIPPVRATFHLNDSEVYVAEIPVQSAALPTQVDEGDLTASANAEIPGEIIRPGLEMVVEIDPGGMLPVSSLAAKPNSRRLARFPSSGGITPVRLLSRKWSPTTRPSASTETPCHRSSGASVSQLSPAFQRGPPVAS